jgi:hypothetical protein
MNVAYPTTSLFGNPDLNLSHQNQPCLVRNALLVALLVASGSVTWSLIVLGLMKVVLAPAIGLVMWDGHLGSLALVIAVLHQSSGSGTWYLIA